MLRDGWGELQVKATRNIDQLDLYDKDLPVIKSVVMQVAETGVPVLTTDAQEDPHFGQQNSVAEHNLRSILCVPMKLREEVIGVIYVDNRVNSHLFQKDDRKILSAIMDQATIAIDHVRVYDKTLEGWSLALELRDIETEDHNQRVKDLTLLLADWFGVDEGEREHMKRGAVFMILVIWRSQIISC